MSIDLINHTLTTSTTDENGVTWWSNPVISVTLSEEGKVKHKDSGKYVSMNKTGSYTFKLNINKKWAAWCGSFNSLFSRMVLGVRLVNHTMKLKDPALGYTVSNVEVIPNYKRSTQTVVQEPKKVFEDVFTETEQFYTLHEAKNEYITEDGGVFPTKELAEWHQEKVSKGKGNAQVVLDYNGGWVLAEQIYLQEVVYRCPKPYKNFKDVMDNTTGILNKSQSEQCVFSNLDTGLLWTHGLSHLEGFVCSKDEAETINAKLVEFISKYKTYTDSWNDLRKVVESV